MALFFWVWMGAVERPYDGIDQDGDGRDLVDVDGDGWSSTLVFGGDCNDRDATVHPRARDRWGDGVDSNCDGADGNPTAWSRLWGAVRTAEGRRPTVRALQPSMPPVVRTHPGRDKPRK